VSDRRPPLKDLIKTLLLIEPNLSRTDLQAKLRKLGVETSSLTVAGITSEFRHTMKLLRKLDVLKEDFTPPNPDWLNDVTLGDKDPVVPEFYDRLD
jgi:hypothetical protein